MGTTPVSEVGIRNTHRPSPDRLLVEIADYVTGFDVDNSHAREIARYCLMDSMGCGLLALSFPACTKMLGPVVCGATLAGGARVPGTTFELDPVQAAFNIGIMIRWLDYNDTWLAAEWGHPSDNLGGILATADYLSRSNIAQRKAPLTMGDVLTALIKAYEIQGVIALENSFNRVGLDHVLLVRVATTAVITALLGGNRDGVINGVSNAWIDGGALRAYRHAPNTGSRKSWAAGDATSRGVQLALICAKGEMGYPSALSAKTWGFYDAYFGGQPFLIPQAFGTYVVENILFKVAFPAEFHAQTAVEAAIILHPQIENRIEDIDKIVIETQQAAMRIIDKTGPLDNPADRDHCIQYMVSVGLLFGRLTADDYEDHIARDPRIDSLREKIVVVENPDYSRDYLEPSKRSIGNAVQVFFRDGSSTDKIEIAFPIGHHRRRKEGIPLLMEKFERHLGSGILSENRAEILDVFKDQNRLEAMPVNVFMKLFSLLENPRSDA